MTQEEEAALQEIVRQVAHTLIREVVEDLVQPCYHAPPDVQVMRVQCPQCRSNILQY